MDKFSFTLPTSSDYYIVPSVIKTHEIFLYLELLCRQRQAEMVAEYTLFINGGRAVEP